MSSRLASVVATAILILSALVLLGGHAILAHTPAAIAVQVAAAALMFWARWTFGRRSFHAAANPTAGELVTSGPYRYWRHPIYAAILLFLWAGTIDHILAPSRATPGPLRLSASVILVVAIVATLATAVRIRAEETLLRATYPDYARYEAETKRLIPFVF